ncbi:hypothetical protein AMECASPLE_020481 [Ameca splendens]|uniref:Secreted protein n=1 Tax=Ameca splendens TaxID=208324 RepID=A0ABV0XS57_9TELE
MPQCTGLLLLWLPPLLDLSWMFSRSPACPPSHALRQTRQYQSSNRHPLMSTHFSSDDRITTSSSFPLARNVSKDHRCVPRCLYLHSVTGARLKSAVVSATRLRVKRGAAKRSGRDKKAT